MYIHKELMKRTLGTPTCAIEAREYVVSPRVWCDQPHTVATQSLTPLTTPVECAVEMRFVKTYKENLVGGKLCYEQERSVCYFWKC